MGLRSCHEQAWISRLKPTPRAAGKQQHHIVLPCRQRTAGDDNSPRASRMEDVHRSDCTGLVRDAHASQLLRLKLVRREQRRQRRDDIAIDGYQLCMMGRSKRRCLR